MSNYKSNLQSNNTALSSNNLDLQALIDQANALPDAGGVDLPILTNEGTASDLLAGKELIDGDGSKVTGTFTINSELNAQDNLISQIQIALRNKASASEPDITSEINAYTTKLATLETAISALETELQGKASGGGANFETSVVTLTASVPCIYLGIDFQSKDEATASTFETVKNSPVLIFSTVTGGSGYTLLVASPGVTIVQPIETIVNITVSKGSGAD